MQHRKRDQSEVIQLSRSCPLNSKSERKEREHGRKKVLFLGI